METCANPGCDQPGTNKCSACKTTPYCGPTCQKAHWAVHRESCDGHLRKLGMAHLDKAKGFLREHNWSQVLRYSDLAAMKLMQMKDRPVDHISIALSFKCTALDFLDRHRERLECAKEWYCLWNKKPTDTGAIESAFTLISSCINNKVFADAVLYASTLWEIINHKHDNKIPDDERHIFTAKGAYYLALATFRLAQTGGIPSEEKPIAGREAIALARRALEIHSQIVGADDNEANDMVILAEALDYFNDDEDEEVLRLFEQAKAIHTRVYGSSSANVAACEGKLRAMYLKRSNRFHRANDLDRMIANLELALPRCREEARIYRAIGNIDDVNRSAQSVEAVEDLLHQASIERTRLRASQG